MSKYTFEDVARVAHQVNKAYCEMIGDNSHFEWEDAPEWQRLSAILGVEFHHQLPDAGPEASHNSWYRQKEQEGWVYGPVKDPEAKQHPCMVPFSQLPPEQQVKDELFKAVCNILEKLP
jgi:hypothetical protein